MSKAIKAIILGLQGKTLSESEKRFFAEHNPLGFILFSRNIEDRAQVKALVNDLRACVGRADAPVLIDQEGGRVARLKAPHFRTVPAAGLFATVADRGMAEAVEGVYLNARLIADELLSLGINVDCAPVADLPTLDCHDIIGDRAYGETPEQVIALAQAMCDGLADGGVTPIIKHIPGHGRATADSHENLPVVHASRAELEKTDFKVFKGLAKAPWAMTAHILYTALDAKLPATLSPQIIELIRKDIGFDGVLISDDISMKALQGSFADRAREILKAGCDLVLHCNGDMNEMQQAISATAALTDQAAERVARGICVPKPTLDLAQTTARLDEILGGVAA